MSYEREPSHQTKKDRVETAEHQPERVEPQDQLPSQRTARLPRVSNAHIKAQPQDVTYPLGQPIEQSVNIRQSRKRMRGMIAGGGTIISGANPIPRERRGRGRARKRAPPAGAFARTGYCVADQGSDDDAPSTTQGRRMWRPDVARRRPISEILEKKKARGDVRAGLAISL